MQALKKLDDSLNGITMYRLLVYILCTYLLVGIGLSAAHQLSISAADLLISSVIILGACYGTNLLCAQVLRVTANSESWLITALILACILPPASTPGRMLGAAAAGVIAMASKYILTIRGRHLFNPAALAAVLVGLLGLSHAAWWVGSRGLLPFTIIGGLLIVRKIRHGGLFITFLAVAVLTNVVITLERGTSISAALSGIAISGPLIFFGSIMLTEPATMPAIGNQQLLFGYLVGLLFSAQLHIGVISTAPEVALVLGNIYAFWLNPSRNLILTLSSITQLSPTTFEFSFVPNHRLAFIPGQYLRWTLPLPKSDRRGNRRTFTVASSPTEPELKIGVKFYAPSSAFKTQLQQLKPGAKIMAGQLAGSFILPRNQQQKLAFIAGGIGVTPFRSIIKYLTDMQQSRDIVLFYSVATEQELCYRDIFSQAAAYDIRLVPVVGRVSSEIVGQYAPDYLERQFYISGPNVMVDATKQLLQHDLKVTGRNIKTDHFSGY